MNLQNLIHIPAYCHRNVCSFSVAVLLFFSFLGTSCSKKENDEPIDDKPVIDTLIVIAGKTYNIDSFYLEKINPAITYTFRQLKNKEFPLVVHTLEWKTTQPGYQVEAWKGKDSLRGTERTSALAKRKTDDMQDVIAAINGGFFSMADGTPTGGEMVSGVMIRPPNPGEPIIAFDKNNFPYMDFMSWGARAIRNNQSLAITDINGKRETNALVLYHSFFGKTTKTNQWGTELLLKPISGSWETLNSYKSVPCIVEKKSQAGSMEIPKGSIVLSGHGTAKTYLDNIAEGETLTVETELILQSDKSKPEIWNMISTHNIILRDNQPVNLTDDIARARNPRTAVGFANDGSTICFIVVEGRLESSKGVTTSELSDIFLHLNLPNAVNLDGGGSSCMVIDQKIKNQLVDNYERPVTDGLMIVKKN